MSSNPSVMLSCLHPHAAANEAVTLLEGAVTVPANGGDLKGTGALALRWLPSRDLRLDADLESGWNGPHPAARIRINIAGNDAETLVNSTNVGVKEGVSFSRISESVSTFVKGSGDTLMADDAVFLNPGQARLGRDGFPAGFSTAHQQARIRCISELEEVVVIGEVAHTLCRDSRCASPYPCMDPPRSVRRINISSVPGTSSAMDSFHRQTLY